MGCIKKKRMTWREIVQPGPTEFELLFENGWGMERVTPKTGGICAVKDGYVVCEDGRSLIINVPNKPIAAPSRDEVLRRGLSFMKYVRFQNNADRIENGAFKNFANLEKVCLPESDARWIQIGNNSFEGCGALRMVEQPRKLDKFGRTVNKVPPIVIGKEAFLNCGSFSEFGDSQTRVARIGEGAFKNCKSFTHFVAEYCGEVGPNAFKNSGLEYFKMYTNTPIFEIGVGAFYNCTSLRYICAEMKNIKEIKQETFYDCKRLQIMDIGALDNLKKIGKSAFEGCTALKDINIFNCGNLEVIEQNAFFGCRSLKAVDLNANLKLLRPGAIELQRIGRNAFRSCVSLEKIDFSQCGELRFIGTDAFRGCSSLKQIDLSECTELERIGDGAFAGCTALKIIKFPPDFLNKTDERGNRINDIGKILGAGAEFTIKPSIEGYMTVFVRNVPQAQDNLAPADNQMVQATDEAAESECEFAEAERTDAEELSELLLNGQNRQAKVSFLPASGGRQNGQRNDAAHDAGKGNSTDPLKK